MVALDDVFAAEGVTESQVWPVGFVAVLVVNETKAGATGAVKLIGCDKEVVEPCAADGVQAAGLGVTAGGGVPAATRVAGA